ncbi:hypothetical protein [Cryobacterium sp. TMT3-29-2]|uniref:hypothetical protein n=1 Tax=Cryobacterium sp. TMT3-29-2 TaxID=2555867 RepID=UPI001073D25C|nr:hypothetical protein [Cryobacterium sp. TMT3-29-2]TFC93978.1 hypothetical protein E3O67_00430 [Cryobacterium sp. TMT3-29-2]
MTPAYMPKPPAGPWPTVNYLARSTARSGSLLARRRVHLPRHNVGCRLPFTDGTAAVVFRETVVDRDPTRRPAVVLVRFTLLLVRGRGHALFRAESILNTPLFVGFPGYVSTLWLGNDEKGFYRGISEWDGPLRAENYARILRRVLEPFTVPGSIQYRVLPGIRRDDFLANPVLATAAGAPASTCTA